MLFYILEMMCSTKEEYFCFPDMFTVILSDQIVKIYETGEGIQYITAGMSKFKESENDLTDHLDNNALDIRRPGMQTPNYITI